MALINKLSTALQREAKELASKAGITLEEAAENIIEREGQKAFGLTTKPTMEDFPTDPSRFLGTRTAKENRSLSETLAAGEKASSAAAPVSKEQSLVPYTRGELVPVGSVKARSSEEIRLPARLAREVEERGASQPPPESTTRPRRNTTQESPSEDFAAGLEDLDTNIYPDLFSPTGRRVAAGTAGVAGAAGLAGALRDDIGSERYRKEYESTLLPSFADATEGVGPVASPEQYAASLANLSTPEIKDEAKKNKKILDELQPPVKPETEQQEAPVVDRFKQQRDEAYKLYNEAKTRNDWLEVAQLIASAVGQYGAARAGAGPIQVPNVDYMGRTEREARLLERRLKDISEEQEREQTLADRLKRDQLDQERLGLERRRVEIAEREARLPKESAEEKELRKERAAEKKKAIEAMEKIVGAQQILTNEDATQKQVDKANEIISNEAAKVGLDLEAVELQPGVRVPGTLWGSTVDETKKLKTFQQVLQQLKQDVGTLQKSRTPSTVRVRKGNEVLEIPEADLAAARKDGYELER